MAKLHNYYILCPLIDQKSFLGVAQDKEADHVIITLGRNVVNKHRLSDQKQISGWTSKDHITSPVVYDKEQDKYVGIFNKNTIKMWNDDNTNLDKLKKYKFPINIFKFIVRDEQPPLIIFANGNTASLPYAIENRKTYESKSLLKDTDEIVDMAWYKVQNTDYICYILKTSDGYEIIYCPIRDELGDLERSKLSRVKITRDDNVSVVGKLIYMKYKCSFVYILWSDAKMTIYNMNTKKWKTVGTVPWISTSSSVSMAWMGKNHLIIFGSNKEQDGAIIVAYNYILGVASCRYPMKMYRENAQLYCHENRIILEASNHIGMLPFTLEINRNLSSLLGSNDVIMVQDEGPQVADWGISSQPLIKPATETDAVTHGLSERSACALVVPSLFEKKDTKGLIKVIQEFKDIPESILASLVRYAIKLQTSEKTGDDGNDDVTESDLKSNNETSELLNEIFKVLFCDALLIPHLRNNLTVIDSLRLLKYIQYLLFESNMQMEDSFESRLYDWCTLILDAFYQQYVISKCPEISSYLIHFSRDVSSVIKNLSKVSDMVAELDKLLSQRGKPDTGEQYLPYTIEMMTL